MRYGYGDDEDMRSIPTKNLKIGISGIRGIVGDTLTPGLLTRFAQSFGTYINGGTVVLGYDTRRSNEMAKHAVLAGLLSCGCPVVDVGICPVPTVQLMVTKLRARGGIAITASHNPAEWNALKFIREDGIFLNALQAQELLDIYHQGEFRKVGYKEIGRTIEEESAHEIHISEILRWVDPDKIRKRRFRVAIDCCNGAGSTITPKLLEALGCEVIAINTDPNGIFPHPPEPVPENLKGLCDEVLKSGADIGFAQDADADRLAIVSEEGKPIGEEYTLVIASDFVLRRDPGPVVANIATTKALDDLARRFGCRVIRTPVGEVNVAERMKREGAVVGGEGNGGVIVPKVHIGRDSLVAIAATLQHLSETNMTVSELVNSLPKYFMIKGKIECGPDTARKIMIELERIYRGENLDLMDGLKVERDLGWFHVRASQTEPLMRISVEARTEEDAKAIWEEVMGKIDELYFLHA
jgi:phosphomannomutase